MLGKNMGEVMWALVNLYISKVELKKRRTKYTDQTLGKNIHMSSSLT